MKLTMWMKHRLKSTLDAPANVILHLCCWRQRNIKNLPNSLCDLIFSNLQPHQCWGQATKTGKRSLVQTVMVTIKLEPYQPYLNTKEVYTTLAWSFNVQYILLRQRCLDCLWNGCLQNRTWWWNLALFPLASYNVDIKPLVAVVGMLLVWFQLQMNLQSQELFVSWRSFCFMLMDKARLKKAKPGHVLLPCWNKMNGIPKNHYPIIFFQVEGHC